MSATLEDPLDIGPVTSRNRLYRAPLLEVAANKPNAPTILRRELEPAAATGTGLIFQGACLVTAEGGRTAPGLTRVHDPGFVEQLAPTVQAIQDHGAKLFCQLGHGALQSMELWHAAYRDNHPDLPTYAVADPPGWLKALWNTPILLEPNLRIFTEGDLETLAQAFGQAAGSLHEAGYDGIHLAGANGSIFQQLWSPVFNQRTDAYGGDTLEDRARFMRRVVEEIRAHTHASYPVTTKIPAETQAPRFVHDTLNHEDGVKIAEICEDLGLDAVVPVEVGITRDQAVARGRFPRIGWTDERFQEGYEEAFGSAWRKRLIQALNRVAAKRIPPEPAWNEAFAAKVRDAVEIPVLLEGGLRERVQMDRVLAEGVCDGVGMARPFYAEPRIAHRILHEEDAEALCKSCNNCTIPQVAGAEGVCRTPSVMRERGRLAEEGRYGG